VVFHPDGKTLVAAGVTVTAWDLTTSKEIVVARPSRRVFAVSYSPDGKFVAWANSDNTLTVWDAAACKDKAMLKGRSTSPEVWELRIILSGSKQ
jgi:WD40 repeat protein